MSAAETILKEVMLKLKQGPNGMAFETAPTFLERRVESLPTVDEQRAAVASLASLGFVLKTQQDSPDASRVLMAVVDRIAKRLGEANP